MTNTKHILPFTKMYDRQGWVRDTENGRVIERYYVGRLLLYERRKEMFTQSPRQTIGRKEGRSRFFHSTDGTPADRFGSRSGVRYYWYVGGILTGVTKDANTVPIKYRRAVRAFQKMYPNIEVDGNWSPFDWSSEARRIKVRYIEEEDD